MTILVTGAAGFIGFHVSLTLLARGERVIGVDNLNRYYDVSLKEARLSQLQNQPNFQFYRESIADRDAMERLRTRHPEITHIIHLAAQPGVRYSLEHPFAYAESNLVGHLTMLEFARHLPKLEHFVYASSSSVYGGNTKLPFSTDDPVEQPVSLYAATKRADELMSYSYSHLYSIPSTGLRFFTVYGPWGRPDMAAFLFTKAILEGKPIRVFNNGNMRRDFTYIDDIVSGILGVLKYIPSGTPPHHIYNLGNHRSEALMDFIGAIEQATGKKAELDFQPIQPGEVVDTFADIEASERDFGFKPATSIAEGIPNFVTWYTKYYNIS